MMASPYQLRIHGRKHRQVRTKTLCVLAGDRPVRVPTLGRKHIDEALARFGSRVREKSHVKIKEIASPLSTSTEICCPTPPLPLTSSFAIAGLRGISYVLSVLFYLQAKIKTQDLLTPHPRKRPCRGHEQWRVNWSFSSHD